MGTRTSEPPRLWRVTQPGPAASAASSLSLPAASPPAPPRCRSEEDAPRVRAAAPAAASLQHRLTAASAPGPAPQARALDQAALMDERRSQCKGAEAASPAAPRAHSPPARRTQASRPQGIRALTCRSRTVFTLEPGPPRWQTLSPAPMPFLQTQVPYPLAHWVGSSGPAFPAGGPQGQRPEAGRAEEESVGSHLGHQASRTGVGPGPRRPLLAMPRGGPVLTRSLGKGDPACGCGGLSPASCLAPTSHRPGCPGTEEDRR